MNNRHDCGFDWPRLPGRDCHCVQPSDGARGVTNSLLGESHDAGCQTPFAGGQRIEAIRCYREIHHVSLAEAKDAVRTCASLIKPRFRTRALRFSRARGNINLTLIARIAVNSFSAGFDWFVFRINQRLQPRCLRFQDCMR